MTSSLGGAVALFLLGGGSLALGALGWVARTVRDAQWRPGRPAVVVDLLVGVVAVGEASTGFTERPVLVLAWSAGAAALTVVAVVLARRIRRPAVAAVGGHSAEHGAEGHDDDDGVVFRPLPGPLAPPAPGR